MSTNKAIITKDEKMHQPNSILKKKQVKLSDKTKTKMIKN